MGPWGASSGGCRGGALGERITTNSGRSNIVSAAADATSDELQPSRRINDLAVYQTQFF